MPRRKPPKPPPDEVIERLRGYLQFLGLTHTLANLPEHLGWAARNKPSHTDLFEHVLAQEVAIKTEHRIERRIRLSGLKGLNNKVKVTTRKSYGFRTFKATEVALFQALGDLPEPERPHRFC